MTIETILSPKLYPLRQLNDGHTAVAVDILRATSAICAAFYSGASEIVPLSSVDLLQQYASSNYIVAAERNGSKLPGATLGNSPTEYLKLNLSGKRIAYSTTNGTVSITAAAEASGSLYVGAFSNISLLAEKVSSCSELLILCSGWKGDPSLEDTLFAGALIDRLKSLSGSVSLLNDASSIALSLWNSAANDPEAFCSQASHVARLQRLNYQDDIDFAFRLDTCPVLPCYNKQTSSLFLV